MDTLALALAKKFTEETALGGGAIKGKNCTIQSIEPVDGGNNVTFSWTLDDGTAKTQVMFVANGEPGPAGKDGVDGKDGKDGETPIIDETFIADIIEDYLSENPVEGVSDPLSGKRVICVGDSICEGVGANNQPYAYWLKQWHPDTEVINLGVGGMTIAQKDSSITNSMPVRIASGEFENYADVDVVVFEGGINDLMNNVKLGYISKGYTVTNYKTFCQGMEYMFSYFKNLFPTARMIFLSTHNVTAYDYNKAQAWWGAASEICAKWGVEFLDLFSLICTPKINGLQLHPEYTVHRDYYAKYLNMALISEAPLAGSRTSNYYKHNVPVMLQFYSGTKQVSTGKTVNTSDWRMNMVRGDLTTYVNVSSEVTYDMSDVDTATPGTYPVHVAYTEDGITLSTDVDVTVVENAGGNEEPDIPDVPSDITTWDDTTTVTAQWKTNEGVFSNTTLTEKYTVDQTYNVQCKLMVESDSNVGGGLILRLGGPTYAITSFTVGEVIEVNAQMNANTMWTLGNMQPNVYTTDGTGLPWTVHIKDLTITT